MLRTSDLNKWRSRPGPDRWLLLEAVFWLILLRVAIELLPFRRIARFLGLGQAAHGTAVERKRTDEAERIAWAVNTAATRLSWTNTCLVQALTGAALMSRHAIPGTLYLGVTKDANAPEGISAHAWLSCGDEILTEAAGHERFTIIATFKVA